MLECAMDEVATPASAAVLLGAGASVDARIPAAVELTRLTLEQGGRPPISSLINYVVSVLQLADSQAGGSALVLPDIERVVSAVEMLANRDKLEAAPFIRDWDGYIAASEAGPRELSFPFDFGELMRQMQQDTRVDAHRVRRAKEMFERAVGLLVEPARSETFSLLYGWLVQSVVDLLTIEDPDQTAYLVPLVRWAAARPESVVATLNYDLSFETAASQAGIGHDVAVAQWQISGELTQPRSGVAQLLKLHGSIDWCLIDTRRDPLFATHPAQGVRRARPGLIYGQRGKLRAEGPFLQLLEEFRRRLSKQERLIAVGYSFRDEHINVLISRWLAYRPHAKLIIVNPGLTKPAGRSEEDAVTLSDLWANFGYRPASADLTVPGSHPERLSQISFVRESAKEYFARWKAD
jgi:SIR2-like domain